MAVIILASQAADLRIPLPVVICRTIENQHKPSIHREVIFSTINLSLDRHCRKIRAIRRKV
uniref:Uncharacterized protein n=1 Tax=Rhizophora mucronata TaxID=61149 RepID=A0A2P2JKT1_RHIMU